MLTSETRSPASPVTRRLAILAIGAAALVAPFAAAAPAAAHSSVVGSTPGGAATDEPGNVDALPDTVSVTFSDDLTVPLPADQQQGDESNTQVRVFDSTCAAVTEIDEDSLVGLGDGAIDCHDYADGEAVVDGPTVSQQVGAAGAPAGEYTVVWQVVYGDGHPDGGSFTFVADEAVDAGAAPEATATPDTTEETPAAGQPADDAASSSDGLGLSTPTIIAIVGGVVVLALIAFLIVMIARSRRSSSDDG